MTEQELKQCNVLKKDIEFLMGKIVELEKKEELYCTDIVKASDVDYPYTSHSVKIYGYDTDYNDRIFKSIKRKKLRLRKLMAEYEELDERIINYIYSLDDGRMRRILRMRFIEEKSWTIIAEEISGKKTKVSPDSVRMECKRFLEKNKVCS